MAMPSPRRPDSFQRMLKRWLKRMSIPTIIFVVAVISMIITVASIYLVAPSWRYGDPLTADQWGALEGFSATVTLAFAVGAGLFFLFEFMETSDSRNLDIYRDIYDKFMSDDQIESRRYIYTHVPDDLSPAELSAHVRGDPLAHQHVKNVLNAIDYFGFLADQDWVTADEMIGWVSPIVVKIWQKIGPLVEYEVAQRPTEPDYYEAARLLAARCAQWRSDFAETGKVVFSDERL